MKPESPSIYLVEDESLIAMELRDRLTALGYHVCGHAARGEQALTEIPGLAPNLVLMDIHLAGKIDGIETAARLRETAGVPVVFLTAYSDSELVRRAGELDSFGYLVKPFAERELHATIQMALHKHRLECQLKDANARLEAKVRERTAELSAKNSQLQDLFDNANDLIQSVAPDGRIAFVNRAWCDTLGYTPAELPALNIFQIIAPDCRAHCGTLFEQLFRGEKIDLVQVSFLAKDGRRVELEGNVNVRFEQGQPVMTRGIFRDVTARERTEAALRESRDQLDLALRSAGMGVWHWDFTTDRRMLDRQACRLLGIDPATFTGTAEEFYRVVHPDDHPGIKTALQRTFEADATYESDYRVILADGSVRYIAGRGKLVRDDSGQPLRIDGIVWDATVAKQAEAALRDREALLSSINANLAGTCLYRIVHSPDGHMQCVYVSPNVEELVGIPAAHFLQDTASVFGLIHAEDVPALRHTLAEALRTGAPASIAARVRTAKGTERWVQFRSQLAERRPDGTQVRDGVVIDITTVKAAEAELQATHQRLALALRASRTCTWQDEVAANRLTLDPAWAEMLGHFPRETVTTTRALVALAHPDDRSAILAEARRAILGETDEYQIEHRVATAAGDWIWIRSHGRVAERDAKGRAIRIVGTNTDITARRIAEEELRQLNARLEHIIEERTAHLARSEHQLRLVWESTRDGMRLTNADGTVVRVNEAYCRLMGQPRTTLEGRLVSEPYADAEREHILAMNRRRFLDRSVPALLETAVTLRDGTKLQLELANAFVSSPGEPELLLSVFRNVTERKLAEATLRQSEERFRAVFDHSPIIIGLLSAPEGRIVELNAAALTAFGYTRAEVLGRTSLELGLWADPADRDRYLVELRAKGHLSGFEARMRRKNGEIFTVLYSGSLIEIAGQTYSLNSLQDITAQRESEARFRHVFENAPVGIYRTTPDGDILLANPALLTMLGYASLEELAHRDLEHPEWFVEQARSAFKERVERDDEVHGLENAWRRADGSIIYVSESARAIRNRSGKILYYEGTVEDITARRQAETMLRESEARFRGVFDASPIPILLSAVPEGRLLEANAAALASFGYTREEIVGRTTQELGVWTRPEQRNEFFQRIAAEKSFQGFEAVMRTKSGEERVMLCTGTLLEIAGRPCVLTSAVDITGVRRAEAEKAQLQERLFQNQKYEALGTLAGGVAHDFNNILTGVINYTELAHDDCPPTHPQIREFLGEVLKCGNRAKELVRQILLFSRAEEGRQEPVLIQMVLKEAIALLRSTLPSSATIEADIDRQAPSVMANATQMHQVVMNLVINSSHALKGQPGRIAVRLQPHAIDAAAARRLPELRPGPHVRLEVTDTGCGMDETVLARIFEPFFTTKPVGEGTGLGLSVVHSVIRSHRGAITVRSRPGAGTTFEIFLPVHAGAATPATRTLGQLPRGRGERILIVDDERTVANSGKLVLERLGYQVTVFTVPEQALAHFENAPDDFDAMIVDYQMPRMTGLALATQILARRPALPVLMASGFTGSLSVDSLRKLGIAGLVQKPMEMQQLATAVARLLAPKPPQD